MEHRDLLLDVVKTRAALPRNRRRVLCALARRGLRPRRCDLLTTFGGGNTRRAAFRVELADGSVVKARTFLDDDVAAANEARRAGLPSEFAPILFRDGRVAAERWVLGQPLAPAACDPELLARAASLLANLHKARPGALQPTGPFRDDAASGLDLLAAHGLLAGGARAALRDALREDDPRTARTGLTHGDFCAENMVVAEGRLHVVDNEDVAPGPLDGDLGRTWCRWPMPDAALAFFLETYARAAGRVPEGLLFWRIVAATRSAALRLRLSPESAPAAAARLVRLAGPLGER